MGVAGHLDLPVDEVYHLEFNAADRDPFDMNGVVIPVRPTEGDTKYTTKFSRSPLMDQILEIFAAGYKHIVLQIEEVTQCQPDMLKALRHLVDTDTRTLGGEKISDHISIFMTGNRTKDRAGSGRMLSHFANAIMRLEMGFSMEDWLNWAEEEGIHPLMMACAQANVENEFFVESVPTEDVQFCTPRTFARCHPIFNMFTLADGTVNVCPEFTKLIAAWIGQPATDVVVNFLALQQHLPTREQILNDPDNAPVNDNTSVQFAAAQLALSLAKDARSGDAVLRYLVRLRQDLQISSGAMLLKKSARDEWPLNSPLANQFVAKYSTVLPQTSTRS
jgi:hypothetical protein